MTNGILERNSGDLQVIVNALQESAVRWESLFFPIAQRARKIAGEIDEQFQRTSLNGSIFHLRWARK